MMRRTVTPRRMQELDRRAQEIYGIPSLVLMENAGRGAAEEALAMLRQKRNKRVLCVCGKGNNAGDGFVCARHLANNGVSVDVFFVASAQELKGDAKIHHEILLKMGERVKSLLEPGAPALWKKSLRKASLVIDAIFGIGFSGEAREPFLSVIRSMNGSGKPILSIDVPSGLDALTGEARGACVKATKTVTFVLPKRGFFAKDGPRHTGEVIVRDISIPRALLARIP